MTGGRRRQGHRARPVGVATRGTTAPQRLRRVDRWLLGTQLGLLAAAARPLVVDLGFGASPVTTVELWARLRAVLPDVEVLGVEIDPERVQAARSATSGLGPGLSFATGGFELAGVPAGREPVVVRAFNVLRQYEEAAVPSAWASLAGHLAPGGLLVEGTCDELGRRACWVAHRRTGESGGRPRQLVFAARVSDLGRPSDLAERLPKALIHRNVPGEAVHGLLTAWDAAWDAAAAWSPFGPRARWVEAARILAGQGWPLVSGARRWRQGELAVAWEAVAPT